MPLTTKAISAFIGVGTSEVAATLLTIDHDALRDPIRVCDDAGKIRSLGKDFIHWPFELEYPSDAKGSSIAKLRLANVDRRIGEAVDKITSPPSVRIQMVLVSEPDNLLRDFQQFELRNVRRDAMAIEGDLVQTRYSGEPYPNIRVTPHRFPAIFA